MPHLADAHPQFEGLTEGEQAVLRSIGRDRHAGVFARGAEEDCIGGFARGKRLWRQAVTKRTERGRAEQATARKR